MTKQRAALEELVRTATEVHRISDRSHDAWIALAAALNEARAVITQSDEPSGEWKDGGKTWEGEPSRDAQCTERLGFSPLHGHGPRCELAEGHEGQHFVSSSEPSGELYGGVRGGGMAELAAPRYMLVKGEPPAECPHGGRREWCGECNAQNRT